MQNAERVPRSNGLRCYHQGSSSRGSFIALMLPNIAWAPPYVTGSLLLGSRDTEPRECLHVHKCPRLPVSSFPYDCGRFLCHGHLPVSLQLPLLRRPAYPVCGHGLLFPKLRWYQMQSFTKCCQTLDAIGASGDRKVNRYPCMWNPLLLCMGAPSSLPTTWVRWNRFVNPTVCEQTVSAEIHSCLWRWASHLKAQHLPAASALALISFLLSRLPQKSG